MNETSKKGARVKGSGSRVKGRRRGFGIPASGFRISEEREGPGRGIWIRLALLACVIKAYDIFGKGGLEMKKNLAGILLLTILLLVTHGVAQAQETKLPDPSVEGLVVLDKGTFVEVRDRGPGYHSMILYEVVKGKMRIVDAVRVNCDFTKDPPVIRYSRINDIKEQ
jgi:hypothetical protein